MVDDGPLELREETPAEADLVRRIAAAGDVTASVEEYDKSILLRIRRGRIALPEGKTR